MHGGENGCGRNEDFEKASDDVGMEAVAVEQIRAKCTKESAGLRKASDDAERRSAHSKVNYGQRGGPLLGDRRPKNQKLNRVPAFGHAAGQRHHQPFRPAHSQRREHINNPHSAQIPKLP